MQVLIVEAKLENIPRVTDFVNDSLEALGCPMKVCMQIDIAIDEIMSNIVRYAYGENIGKAEIKVEVTEQPQSVVITFIDSGVPYDPLKAADPDITLSAEERQIGGLGVYMVKKSMDEVEYKYKDGQNILMITKSFGK